MTRFLLLIVVAVIVLLCVSWALGRVIFWLRATFPPNRPSRKRR